MRTPSKPIENNLNTVLDKELEKIQLHKRDKNTLLSFYVEQRLNNSYKNYEEELDSSFRMLTHLRTAKSSRKIIKKI